MSRERVIRPAALGRSTARALPPSLRSWLVPVLLLALAAIVVWQAPDERTLGPAIKAVYVHVALSWVGLLGYGVAAGLALVAIGRAAFPSGAGSTHEAPASLGWAEAVAAVGLSAFALSAAVSLVAARVTWGGFGLAEPRMRTALQILAVAGALAVLRSWAPAAAWRWRAGLHVLLVAVAVWLLADTPLVLHPRSPILSSTSFGIQATFAGLTFIGLLLAAWSAWRLRPAA